MARFKVLDPKSGERYTFHWSAKSKPTEEDITRIIGDQKKAQEDIVKAQASDPANKSILSPDRWASMIPEGITKLGGLFEPLAPEMAPLQAGEVIPQAAPMSPESVMIPDIKKSGTEYSAATPTQVGLYGAGRDIYENAIRPATSPAGIAATVAGAGLGSVPQMIGPASGKLLAHGVSAAMAPGTVESIGEFAANPSIDTFGPAAMQTGFQMLGGAGQIAAQRSKIPPPPPAAPIIPTVKPPSPKLLGPGQPEAIQLTKPLVAPPKTPKRETIVNNRLKALENEALKTGDPKRLQEIMDEVGALEKEVEKIQGKVEEPSKVQVSDKRSVVPTEGELIEKKKVPRIQEVEPLKVTEKRAKVNEPAPRELPTQYQGFDREKFLGERTEKTPDWFQEAIKPEEVKKVEAPKGKGKTKKSVLKKDIVEAGRETAAEKGADVYLDKVAKGKKSNIAGKVEEPGFAAIENGYSMKKLDNGSVILKSPDGTKETYANEGYARARSKRGKKELSQKSLEDEPEGKTGPILPAKEHRFRASKSNPNRILMDQHFLEKFDRARGKSGKGTGTTLIYITKATLAEADKLSPEFGAALRKSQGTGNPTELVAVDRVKGKSQIGTAVETALHEGTHAEVSKLGGLNKYFNVAEFTGHPVARKLIQGISKRGYEAADWADEVFANAMSGGSNRRDLTPTMLGDFLRDYVDKIIEKNPEQGYRILKNMSGPVREVVIYGGNEAFTKATGRGYAEWKRKQSRVETQAYEQGEELRKRGVSEEEVQRRIRTRVYGDQEQRQVIRDRTPEEQKAFDERGKRFDEARKEFMDTGKWNKDKVPEGFYNAVNGITPNGKITPTLQGSGEKGALRLQVIQDIPKLAKGAWEEVISSIRNRVQRQGLSGRQFNVKFERMRTNERMIGEEWNTRFDNTVKKLSKAEKENMVDVIHGVAQPMNPQVSVAVNEVRRLDAEVQQRAHVHGIASQDPWANNKDMNSMHEYLIDQAKIIAKNDEFRGPNVIDNLINSAKDPKEMKHLVDYLFDNLSYAKQSKGLRPYANFAARWEAASKLTYFIVSNVANMATIPLHTSFKNFGKGLAQSITAEGKKFAKSSGAQWEATRNELFDLGKGGVTVSNLNLIPQSERWQRTVAALAGRAAAKDYFKAFKKTGDKYARQKLNELVMDPGGAGNLLQQNHLTDHQLKMAGARMAELTHGIAEKFDLPKSWTDNPYATIPTMFKKYALVGTNNILRAVKANPKMNIPKVLLLTQVFGEPIGDVKAGLQGMFEGLANDEDVLKSALERINKRGEWMKGQHWQKGMTAKEAAAARRIIDNAMQSWFFGMPADIAQSAAMKGESGILEFLAGPHITRLARGAGTFAQKTASKGIEEGIAATAKQQVRESAPLPVRPFLGSAKEDRLEELRKKRIRSGRVQMPTTPKLPNISPP